LSVPSSAQARRRCRIQIERKFVNQRLFCYLLILTTSRRQPFVWKGEISMARFFHPVRQGLTAAILVAALTGAPAQAAESDAPVPAAATATAAAAATAAPAGTTTTAEAAPAKPAGAASDAQAAMPRPVAKRPRLALPQVRRVAYRDGCGAWCGRQFVLMLGIAY